ncbi:gamma-tubulin complex component 4-like isoform X2 [Stegodyphus dumicola]|uniref:gamma-tubulin complex component 4-like isoform X2 n=1 Tax=Stegodyphus dumicola TaxID=202533 RepID=UPI0015ACD8D3|nr:gamma-tubulin complex component 4-like isoform X2 [Stegodyphus dumicola]
MKITQFLSTFCCLLTVCYFCRMLQELLMALSGVPGNIFSDVSNDIKVSSCIPNIHPAERDILERLLPLGSKCKFLREFVKKHKFHKADDKSGMCGLYLESFCCGLEAVLNIYQLELVAVEEELLKDPFLPLTHFLKLDKYQHLFQVLSDIVNEIVKEKIHGCRILELVYNQSSSGVPLIEASMNKILQHCHSVMFKQVFCWIMNGYVEDIYHEFFIQPEQTVTSTCSLEKQVKSFAHPLIKSDKDLIKVKYVIKYELLPSYVPNNLAAQILFVGEYISILRAADDPDSYTLYLKKEQAFAKKIEKLLEKPLFSLLSFEAAIHDIRRCAAEHLWQVIVKRANVVHHLKIMKDFYFLGRGELFLAFICEANQLLSMPVTTTAESEASKIFQSVARIIFPDDDSITDKFRITLQAKSKKAGEVGKESLSKAKLESGWSSVGLMYNTIFRFLLSVRKVQIELHHCWALQMRAKGAGHESAIMPFWKLRSHMSFLIDNFQYYVLVDVLESCFSNLMEKMGNVKDFEEIQQYHNRFLISVVSQCFLELWTVYHPLYEIMEICSSFCSLMNRINLSFSQRDVLQFDNIKQDFQLQTSLLLRVLSRVRSKQVSPHLAQLLLRIDYNKYFLSSCAGILGGTQVDTKK